MKYIIIDSNIWVELCYIIFKGMLKTRMNEEWK